MRASIATIVALLLTGLTSPGGGQTLRGRLLDLDTNEPIAGGVITLIRAEGARTISAVTDEDGKYRIVAPGSGSYLVEVRRLGYRVSIDGPVDLRPGDDWESEYHLKAFPIQLDPVAVRAPAAVQDALLDRVGFYERQQSDFGHFMTRDQIEKRNSNRMTDLLLSIPGVRPVMTTGGLNRTGIELRGSRMSRGGTCHPRVYVDGIIVIRGDARPRAMDVPGQIDTEAQGGPGERREIALNDVVLPQDVQAVEVYRSSAQVPPRFGGSSTATQCGVIVIWTRRGGPRGP